MKRYNERFDAYYDSTTKEWLEPKCSDEDCDYCYNRPDNPPPFERGDRVLVLPNNMEATVINQRICYDGPETFWGNVEVKYDDDVTGVSNSWQLKMIQESA